jgi:hypothetical protein
MKYTLLVNKETKIRSVRINKTGELVLETVDPTRYNELRKKALSNLRQAEKTSAVQSLGLTRVYGAASGKVYWE